LGLVTIWYSRWVVREMGRVRKRAVERGRDPAPLDAAMSHPLTQAAFRGMRICGFALVPLGVALAVLHAVG